MVILEDESLRDGLQAENTILTVSQKQVIFDLLRQAGIRRIQVGSFVNPTVVPQMADTELLLERLGRQDGVTVTGLVLNGRGLERAIASGLEHLSLSLSASNAHSLRNVRKSTREALDSVTSLVETAVASGIRVRAGIQCAFGCVYEGPVPESRVLELLTALKRAGATEFNLADTTGMAHPLQIRQFLAKAGKLVDIASISLHLHNTRGLAIANMVAGYESGVRLFDTSAGGLGGCPFVRGAAGNIATEDAVNCFESMGVPTGIDLQAVCEVTACYEKLLGRSLPGHMSRVLKQEACQPG